MGLNDKILEIMEEIKAVAKDGTNNFQNYSYTSNVEVVKKIRELLVSKKLILRTSTVDETINVLPKGVLVGIKIDFTLIDVESGEEIVTRFHGHGYDTNDKGVYKAYTGAEKYYLLKTFLLPTLDDPENPDLEVKTSNNGKVVTESATKIATNEVSDKEFRAWSSDYIKKNRVNNSLKITDVAKISKKAFGKTPGELDKNQVIELCDKHMHEYVIESGKQAVKELC